jgi:hypothetical protein
VDRKAPSWEEMVAKHLNDRSLAYKSMLTNHSEKTNNSRGRGKSGARVTTDHKQVRRHGVCRGQSAQAGRIGSRWLPQRGKPAAAVGALH